MIKPLRLSQIVDRLGGELHFGDAEFSRVSTDTRSIQPGDLFVALKGEHYDAHNFLSKARDLGSAALVVERLVPEVDCPQILVADTTLALGNIARLSRESFHGVLLAITGSCGKTTVKEMLTQIMSECGQTHATQGNLNNHIGVPLTLLELSANDAYAVIEMGASGLGEIEYLAQIAAPNVTLVNNVAAAHLEGFGSEDGVAQEKSSIYREAAKGGTAVINLDDKYAGQWLQQLSEQRTDLSLVTFSAKDSAADFYAKDAVIADNGCYSFTLCSGGRQVLIRLSMLGSQNIHNAMAAAACAFSAGASLQQISLGLEKAQAVSGRMRPFLGVDRSLLIDDSYNANPGSVLAAVDVLSDLKKQNRETTLVLGDMAELGTNAESILYDLGLAIQASSLLSLVTVGSVSAHVTRGFNTQKETHQSVVHFAEQGEAIDYLKRNITKKSVVLVKGSRSAHMEHVVRALTLGGEKQ